MTAVGYGADGAATSGAITAVLVLGVTILAVTVGLGVTTVGIRTLSAAVTSVQPPMLGGAVILPCPVAVSTVGGAGVDGQAAYATLVRPITVVPSGGSAAVSGTRTHILTADATFLCSSTLSFSSYKVKSTVYK